METNIIMKNLLIFAVGMCVGGLITDKVLKTKYADLADAEIEAYKEYTRKKILDLTEVAKDKDKYSELVKAYANPSETEHPEDDSSEDEEDEDAEEEPDPDTEEQEKLYREYSKVSEEARKEYENAEPPFVITEGDYTDDRPHYEKLTIYYYGEDDTLADDQEEIIHDIDQIIGVENLREFGVGSNDPDVVYIRNEKMGTDYEVVLIHASYKETVIGLINNTINTGGENSEPNNT